MWKTNQSTIRINGWRNGKFGFLINKEEKCSYNKVAEIVIEMVVDKCKGCNLQL